MVPGQAFSSPMRAPYSVVAVPPKVNRPLAFSGS
jgi:hypothetical protein